MLTLNFYQMLKKVEESYKGFNILKSGSLSDKFMHIFIFLLYIGASCFMLWGNIIADSLIWTILSLITFFVIFIIFYSFHTSLQRRENFFYKKGQSKEEEFYNKFIQNLSRNEISISDYSKIIDYYNNLIEKNQILNDKFLFNYIICFLIPVTISFCEINKLTNYLLAYVVLGLMIVPIVLSLISLIVNRKQNMYKYIIYYLKLALIINDK